MLGSTRVGPGPSAPPRPTRARRGWRHAVLGLALAAVAVLATPGIASAHASLIAADPPDGARLDQSPKQVQLTFSEHVSASLGGVRVVDTAGHRVDRGAVRVKGPVVEVDLAPHLPNGTYVVSYRIISADSHPVRGALVFGVGSGKVDTDAARKVKDSGNDQSWKVVGAIGRFFAYGGALLAAGGALFLVLAHRGGRERALLGRRVRIAALVGALGSLVALPVQAALGTGQGPGSLFDHGVLGRVTTDGVGPALLLCLVGLALLAVALDRWRGVTIVGAVVAATSFAMTGHDRVGSDALLTTSADVVHLLVDATWGGGLVLLFWALRARRRATQDATGDGAPTELVDAGGDSPSMVLRFSSMATVAVLAASATGTVLAWREVRTLHALTSTGYGRVLMAKIAVVIAIGAIGAYNHFRLMPALQQGKAKAALRQLGRTLRLEVLGLVVVIGLTAVVVAMTPGATLSEGGPVEKIIQIPHVGSVQVVVAPAKAGFNQMHLYTFDLDHRPVQTAQSVDVSLELPSAQIGPLERTAARAGPAHYQLNGNDLSLAGRWTITVHLKVDAFTEVSGSTQVDVAR